MTGRHRKRLPSPFLAERPRREERHRGHSVPVAGEVGGIGSSLFPARNSAYQVAVTEVVQAPPHDQVSQADQRDTYPVGAEVAEGEGEGKVCLPS